MFPIASKTPISHNLKCWKSKFALKWANRAQNTLQIARKVQPQSTKQRQNTHARTQTTMQVSQTTMLDHRSRHCYSSSQQYCSLLLQRYCSSSLQDYCYSLLQHCSSRF